MLSQAEIAIYSVYKLKIQIFLRLQNETKFFKFLFICNYLKENKKFYQMYQTIFILLYNILQKKIYIKKKLFLYQFIIYEKLFEKNFNLKKYFNLKKNSIKKSDHSTFY